MDKEITIKKVGGGWLVTVWTRTKSDQLGQTKTEEVVFTDHNDLMNFVEAVTS